MTTVAVAGSSLEPALRDGDRLLVLPLRRLPRPGEVVVVRDPVAPDRLLVKRVERVAGDRFAVTSGTAHAGHLADRGLLGRDALVGRAVWRYAPPQRFGRVR